MAHHHAARRLSKRPHRHRQDCPAAATPRPAMRTRYLCSSLECPLALAQDVQSIPRELFPPLLGLVGVNIGLLDYLLCGHVALASRQRDFGFEFWSVDSSFTFSCCCPERDPYVYGSTDPSSNPAQPSPPALRPYNKISLLTSFGPSNSIKIESR